MLPVVAHLGALLGRRELGRKAHDNARGFQARGRLNHGLVGVRARHHHQLDVLARLFRQRDNLREHGGFIFGKNLAAIEPVLAGGRLRHHVDGKHHDVDLARIGPLEDASEVLQMVGIAHRHQHVARPRGDRVVGKVRLRV